MPFLGVAADVVGGLFGGGSKGGSPGGPVRQSQDGSSLRSGTGDFTVGFPKWAIIVGVVGLVLVGGGLVWAFVRKGK